MQTSAEGTSPVEPHLLGDVLPELAVELERHLIEANACDIAEQVRTLPILARCGCDGCGSFYTAPEPDGPWGPGHQSWGLNSQLILDLVNRRIVFVEVLDRDDIRDALSRLFPQQNP